MMCNDLGICVTSKDSMEHLKGIVWSAWKAGLHTNVFLTGDGVHLTQDPDFPEVITHSHKIGICELSYINFKYDKKDLPQLHDKQFVTQMRNAEIVEQCRRYILL
jgi:hypothetical protein